MGQTKTIPPAPPDQSIFDVIITGAGINGAGIARDAAMRGLRVALIDKGDIASGTTSFSTRLIHGGLRYLEHAEIKLVRESLREREHLLHIAPHLVHPLPLILPIYQGARRRPITIRAGMMLYDALSYDKSLPRHQMLNREQILQQIPALTSSNLLGGARYYDAQVTFPERLTVENVISAQQHGATLLTHTRVDHLLMDGAVVRGVSLTDCLTGETFPIKGRIVVNVAGPWVDQVLHDFGQSVNDHLVGGTKGSHIVVNPFPGAPQDALYYEAQSDGRAIFIVPWNQRYLIGTTDIRFEGDLDNVHADTEELNYLIRETNTLIPSANLRETDVLYSYSGVRPLPASPAGTTGAITRKHIIHDHTPEIRGFYSIIGGKLTTYRSLAEEMVDTICHDLAVNANCRTATTKLPGAAGIAYDVFAQQFIAEQVLPNDIARRLVHLYGKRAQDIARLATETPDLARIIDPDSAAIAAEIVFAFQHESAKTLEDVLMRRTMIGLGPRMGIGADKAALSVAERYLGWSSSRATNELLAYRHHLARFRPRDLEQIDKP